MMTAERELLLARQIRLARAVGAEEVLISGRAGADYSSFSCPVLLDRWAGCGPLAGIERGLAACRSALLLVLAVDLPHVDLGLLESLLAQCSDGIGAVPLNESQIEPLIAIYPRAALPLAVRALESDRHAVQEFARSCEEHGLVRFVGFPEAAARLFTNWNCPADVGAKAEG